MNLSAEPIRRRRLHEILTERLLTSIASGELAVGQAMPSETELAEHYGVGRPTVREALQKLEVMGVVAIAHGERARVVQTSAEHILNGLGASIVHLLSTAPENLDHLQEVRLLIEEAMVRRFVAQADPTSLASVEAALLRQEAAVESGRGFFAADMAFHVAIAEGAGNPLFPIFLRAMLDWLGAFHASTVRLSGFEALALAEHQAVFRAILAQDEAGAAAAMRAHLLRSSHLYGTHRQARADNASSAQLGPCPIAFRRRDDRR